MVHIFSVPADEAELFQPFATETLMEIDVYFFFNYVYVLGHREREKERRRSENSLKELVLSFHLHGC